MNWNFVNGSHINGKSFPGDGLPDKSRSWFESYGFDDFDTLQEGIINDYFYFSGVVKEGVCVKKLDLKDGSVVAERYFDQVSYCSFFGDDAFVGVGGVALLSDDLYKVFDQRRINPSITSKSFANMAVVGDYFFCSGSVSSSGHVVMVDARNEMQVSTINQAVSFLSYDGGDNYVFCTSEGVLFWGVKEGGVRHIACEDSIRGAAFSNDGMFYFKARGKVCCAKNKGYGGWFVDTICEVEPSDFSDFFVYKDYVVVASREKMSIDIYDRFSGEHVHSHPIKVKKTVSGFMRGGIYYSNYDHYPVAYDVMSGELVWRSEDRVTTSKVIGTSKAVIYKFVGGGYQCYYMG